MKTIFLSKTILLMIAGIMLFANYMPLIAQNDHDKEILVYFTSGVERAPEGQAARIMNSAVQKIFNTFKISENAITSAFPKFDEKDTLITTKEGLKIGMPNMGKIFKLKVLDSSDRNRVIEELKKLPEVLFAEPNGLASVDVLPNDTYFSYQWSLQPGTKIRAPEAWDIFQGNSSTKIAVIDEGVDGTHPDLSGKVSGHTAIYGYHGTHVAGIAAAKTNNSTGIAGVDWNAQIIAKAFNDGTSSGDPYIYQIVTEAVNEGSNILNNSWKLINNDGSPGRYSTTVRMAFAYAYKQNRAAIATMGNTGNTTNTVQYPGSFGQGIIAVGATDQEDMRAGFSTYGNAIDVVAPGVSILSTYRSGNFPLSSDYHYASGTSMAAPIVSGIASLLKGYNPNLFNDDIENIIKLSADDKGPIGWDSEYGTGRVNARRALDYLRAPYTLTHATASGGTSSGASGLYKMTIFGASGLGSGVYFVIRHEVRRSVNFAARINPNVWGRGVASNGWSIAEPNFAMGWCDLIPGTLTATSATLRTYVYQVWSIDLDFQGWYPCTPENVNFAYTVLGIPLVAPVISGFSPPSPITVYEYSSVTVSPVLSQGSGPIQYSWSAYYFPAGAWLDDYGDHAVINYYPYGKLHLSGDNQTMAPEPWIVCTAQNAAGSSTAEAVVRFVRSTGLPVRLYMGRQRVGEGQQRSAHQ